MSNAKDTYRERPDAEKYFDRAELKKLRFLLRRLRFLETQTQESAKGNKPNTGGGAVFVESEIESLEFALTEIEYLEIHR